MAVTLEALRRFERAMGEAPPQVLVYSSVIRLAASAFAFPSG